MKNKRSFTIAVKLISYTSVSVIIAVAIMGVLFTVFLNSRFKNYLNLEGKALREELVSNLSMYLDANPTIDQAWMEQFSNIYMEQGMFFSLNSEDGEIMWSCSENNSEICTMHMQNTDLDNVDDLESETYEVTINKNGTPAYLDVQYLPDDRYSENDIFFLVETYRMLLLSMIISLIISAVSAVLFSKTLSRPLEIQARYSVRLANHDYSASGFYKSGTKEIDDVHNAISTLAEGLESQEKLRKRLTADISHELRTPLTNLQSTFEAMIDGIFESDESRLSGCLEEILRLSELVSELDDLHSYDTKLKSITKSRINLKKSVLSAFGLFETEFNEKGHSWEIIGDDVMIEGDEGKLTQVWINLISNSLKFMEKKGNIRVKLDCRNSAEIIFSDNGIGIDAEDIPNIFERFYKAESSRSFSGSGLGLSVVKEIISLHGGTITAVSIKNHGTDFIIELPSLPVP